MSPAFAAGDGAFGLRFISREDDAGTESGQRVLRFYPYPICNCTGSLICILVLIRCCELLELCLLNAEASVGELKIGARGNGQNKPMLKTPFLAWRNGKTWHLAGYIG